MTFGIEIANQGRVYLTGINNSRKALLRSAKSDDEIINKLMVEVLANPDKFKEGDDFSYKGKVIARVVDGRLMRVSPDSDENFNSAHAETTKPMEETKMATVAGTKATAAPKKGATVEKEPKASKKETAAEKEPKASKKETAAEKEPKAPKVDKDRKKLFNSFAARVNYLNYMDHPAAGLPGADEFTSWNLTYQNEAGKTYKVSKGEEGIKFFEGTKNVETFADKLEEPAADIMRDLGWTA